MKNRLKKTGLIFAFLLVFSILDFSSAAEETAKTLDVLFVHDTHSHLNEFATVENGESQVLGGFAKIKTLINEKKAENPDTMILDAGDFSMGTLIQAVFEEEASEIRMLGEIGVEVTTLGNHEYDYRAKGLANMMNNAVASGDVLPKMVISNVDWDGMHTAGLTEDQKLLLDAFENYGVEEYVILEKGNIKVAVTGLFGQDCYNCVINPPLDFVNAVDAMKETVAQIQANEDVDMIVCVSHCGTWEDEEKSEDEILAKAVPELDLIISGHTHTKLEEPIQHGDTYIVSAAEYGKYLGSLSMTQKENGRWNLENYELITVGENIEKDAKTQEKIDSLMDMVDSKYLAQFGYTKDQVLCTNEIEFAPQSDTSEKHTEINLGSIIADAYTYAAEQVLGADTVAMSVAPSGTIRDSYAKGDITTENVFNSFSLGIGRDEIPGYPLLGVYLTGAELRMAAEIDASISDLMTTARLYTDGLYWHYNPNRMILNKATDVFFVNNQEERVELEDDKLYLVVSDLYSAEMLGGVTDLSMGLLSIVPKFEDGTPIENYADAIIMKGDQELKAWVAIADYMSSFEDTDGDGIGNVPAKYGTVEGRKVVEDSKNILDLVKNPNKFFFMIMGVILLLLTIITAVVVFIVKIVKKIKKRKRKD